MSASSRPDYGNMSLAQLQELLKAKESHNQKLCRAWACAVKVVLDRDEREEYSYHLESHELCQYISGICGEILCAYRDGKTTADTDDTHDLKSRISGPSSVFSVSRQRHSPCKSLEPFINSLADEEDDDVGDIKAYIQVKVIEAKYQI